MYIIYNFELNVNKMFGMSQKLVTKTKRVEITKPFIKSFYLARYK